MDTLPQDKSPGTPQLAPETVTKSFSLTREDVAIIEAVRREESLLSDSAALRRLIRDGARVHEARKPGVTISSARAD